MTCAINAYGLFDFIETNRNVPFFAEKAMGVKYKDNPDRYTFLSPRFNVGPDLVPQLVMIGDRDWFYEDSMKYVYTLKEKEASVELWIYEGKNHSFLDYYWNERGTVAYDRMIEFLDKHLKF